MKKQIIIWGASGHAIVLREAVCQLGYDLVALFDNDETLFSPFDDVPLVGGGEQFRQWIETSDKDAWSLVAIGGARGRIRCEIQESLELAGLPAYTVVHPAAYVAQDAGLAPGCQILAGAVVCTRSTLGYSCIVNTGASVDHECVLGKGVHIGPRATLTGSVVVEDYAFVGAGAVVLPRLRIGAGAIVGAGAVVTKDVPSGATVYGIPARARTDV